MALSENGMSNKYRGWNLLLYLQELLPVRIFAVQVCNSAPDQGISEENEAIKEGNAFHHYIAGNHRRQ